MAKFKPKTLPPSSSAVIDSIYEQINGTAEGLLQELNYLTTAITNYRQSTLKSIDSTLEKTDLIVKYSEDQGASYNLPAVMASTTAYYQLEDIKKDNERLAAIAKESKMALDESELYYKIMISNFNDFSRRLKKVATLDKSLKNFFLQLEKYGDFQNK